MLDCSLLRRCRWVILPSRRLQRLTSIISVGIFVYDLLLFLGSESVLNKPCVAIHLIHLPLAHLYLLVTSVRGAFMLTPWPPSALSQVSLVRNWSESFTVKFDGWDLGLVSATPPSSFVIGILGSIHSSVSYFSVPIHSFLLSKPSAQMRTSMAL